MMTNLKPNKTTNKVYLKDSKIGNNQLKLMCQKMKRLLSKNLQMNYNNINLKL